MSKNEGVGFEPIPEIVETHDDEGNDTTNWKEIATQLQSSAKQYEGLAKRNHSDLSKIKTDLETLKNDPRLQESIQKGSGYDNKLVQLSFLNSLGVPREDHEYILEEAASTGKELPVLMDFKYVQEELKNRKESRAAKEAIPSGSKRSGGASANSAEFWLAKIERGEASLGQIPDLKLQREVRKMRETKSSGGRMGTTPVVFGSIRK